jgi:hypothetical protein
VQLAPADIVGPLNPHRFAAVPTVDQPVFGDRLMAGSQRPGLLGIEEPHQLLTYRGEFQQCRRVETLLGWRDDSPAGVAYAAAMAGIATPSLQSAITTAAR